MDSPSTSRSSRSSVSTFGCSSTRYLFNLHSVTRLVPPSGPHLKAQLTNQPQYRSTSLQGLTNSYKSALQTLQIITQEFAPWGMLVSFLMLYSRSILTVGPIQRYGQDSVTVMSAYAAVFLIKVSLLARRRSPSQTNPAINSS